MMRLKPRLLTISTAVLVVGAVGYAVVEQLGAPTQITPIDVTNPAHLTPVSAMAGSDVVKGDSSHNQTNRPSLATYHVAADQPRALYIPSLHIAARIMPMGVTSSNSIQAPLNIYDSGWYTSSARPGQPGAAFIDGHASGSTRMGLFAYLDTMKSGDQLSVEMGDGTRYTYIVRKVGSEPLAGIDVATMLKPAEGITNGLNLVTCTGTWIPSQKTYDHRVVVYTEQV